MELGDTNVFFSQKYVKIQIDVIAVTLVRRFKGNQWSHVLPEMSHYHYGC